MEFEARGTSTFCIDMLLSEDDPPEMTSLARLVFVDLRDDDEEEDDDCSMMEDDSRLTLAYENLQDMPFNLVDSFGIFVRTLDLSNNNFSKLDFLSEFENLTSLILDHNNIDSDIVFPHLPSLQLLWINHNRITRLYPFVKNLHDSFPNLKFLSLMGNPAAPSYLNGGTFYEYLQYRLFVISWFKDLVHLDDKTVTCDQREEASRLYKRPLLERLSFTSLPSYLKTWQGKLGDVFDSWEKCFQYESRNLVV